MPFCWHNCTIDCGGFLVINSATSVPDTVMLDSSHSWDINFSWINSCKSCCCIIAGSALLSGSWACWRLCDRFWNSCISIFSSPTLAASVSVVNAPEARTASSRINASRPAPITIVKITALFLIFSNAAIIIVFYVFICKNIYFTKLARKGIHFLFNGKNV